MTMRQEMDLALEHYSSGRLRDTEGLCREITGVRSQHAEALHLLFALCIGVPLVSFAGPDRSTRVGFSILANAGLPELAARSYDAYVEAAAKLAFALPALSALRATPRSRLQNSVLMNGPRFARNVEAAYRQIW
jgi:hypothetical protein